MESFNQKVKRQIFEMLEASEGKYRSNWDIASEALQIVKNMYKVDDAQELLLNTSDILSHYTDADYDENGFIPNDEMRLLNGIDEYLISTKSFIK